MTVSSVSIYIVQPQQATTSCSQLQKLEEENLRLRSLNENLESEITEVDHQRLLLRCREYERLDGWTRHLSWEDRPGDFYWYCEETGECHWDDEDGKVNEPDWWSCSSD